MPDTTWPYLSVPRVLRFALCAAVMGAGAAVAQGPQGPNLWYLEVAGALIWLVGAAIGMLNGSPGPWPPEPPLWWSILRWVPLLPTAFVGAGLVDFAIDDDRWVLHLAAWPLVVLACTLFPWPLTDPYKKPLRSRF